MGQANGSVEASREGKCPAEEALKLRQERWQPAILREPETDGVRDSLQAWGADGLLAGRPNPEASQP